MRYAVLLFCFILPSICEAQISPFPVDSIIAWAQQAEFVGVVEITKVGLDYNFKDWDDQVDSYQIQFKSIEIWMKADSLESTSFEYESALGAGSASIYEANKRYVVFLDRNRRIMGFKYENPFVEPDPDGNLVDVHREVIEATKTNIQFIHSKLFSTTISKAVFNGSFSSLEKEMKRLVKRANNNKGQNGFAHILWTLQSESVAHEVTYEQCVEHIAIYPGWASIIMRFATTTGPKEYILTWNTGKIHRWGFFRYKLGMKTSQDGYYFHSLKEYPGIIEFYRQICRNQQIYDTFSERWNPEGRWKAELLDDTITLDYPAFRVKTTFYNTKDYPVIIDWQQHVNQTKKANFFRVISPEGYVLEEEFDFIYLPYDSIRYDPPTVVAPFDSISMIQVINDPTAYLFDCKAQHEVVIFQEGPYAVQWKYNPAYPEHLFPDEGNVLSGTMVGCADTLLVLSAKYTYENVAVVVDQKNIDFQTSDQIQSHVTFKARIIQVNHPLYNQEILIQEPTPLMPQIFDDFKDRIGVTETNQFMWMRIKFSGVYRNNLPLYLLENSENAIEFTPD